MFKFNIIIWQRRNIVASLTNIINGNIAKDNYSLYVDSCAVDFSKLRKYYEKQSEYADSLVRDGEFVGRTYDNLAIIKTMLKKQR